MIRAGRRYVRSHGDGGDGGDGDEEERNGEGSGMGRTTLLCVGGLLPGPAGREGARGYSEMEGARATGPSYEGGGDMSRTGINSNHLSRIINDVVTILYSSQDHHHRKVVSITITKITHFALSS